MHAMFERGKHKVIDLCKFTPNNHIKVKVLCTFFITHQNDKYLSYYKYVSHFYNTCYIHSQCNYCEINYTGYHILNKKIKYVRSKIFTVTYLLNRRFIGCWLQIILIIYS